MPTLARSVRDRRVRYNARTGAVPSVPPVHRIDHQARLRAVEWACEMIANRATVFLDTETTGLGPDAEVVDVAVVAADGRLLFETLVRPTVGIPAAAVRIHGIRDADVADAPRWAEVHDRLCALLADRPVVVYNAAYDRRIVAQCCDRHGLADPFARWQCAMLAYAEYRSEWNGTRAGFRWHKLESAASAFGLPPGGHRAAADASVCRGVVLGMANTPLDDL